MPSGNFSNRAVERLRQLPEALAVALIRLYQLTLSPLLGPNCRFHPTCSHYAIEAIRLHGLLAGGWLALRRVGRCHAWHPGGLDPVPPRADQTSTRTPEPAASYPIRPVCRPGGRSKRCPDT